MSRLRARALSSWAVCALLLAPAARADGLLTPCECDVLVGAGATFKFFAWSQGVVIPIQLEIDQSRWEIGAYRLATAQSFEESYILPTSHVAEPYWGFTAMRRWQILHRGWSRLYVGFGANYRTEVDYLVASKWNFAYVIAERFDLPHGALLELAWRHWSDAWIREPDRGQNFVTLSVGF